MADWLETCRSTVFPWNCDFLGHMNVRWYAHFFDDAGWHLWTVVGLPQSKLRERGVSLVVAQTRTDFIHEMRAGELLVVRSAFTHVGTKSIRHFAKLYNADNDRLCATQESVEVFFDLGTRKSSTMPDDIRTHLLEHVVPLDAK